MKNRKGAEHFEVIINNLFYIIIIIFAIVVILNVTKNMDISYEYRMDNMEFNNYAARLLYSPDCLAFQEQYTTDTGTNYRVYPSMIDVGKLNRGRVEKCLWGLDQEEDYDLAIVKFADDNSLKRIYGKSDACGGVKMTRYEPPRSYNETTSNYIYRSASNLFKSGWTRTGSFFVQINEGGEVSRGFMKFCYGKK